jgi:hypothetical protein
MAPTAKLTGISFSALARTVSLAAYVVPACKGIAEPAPIPELKPSATVPCFMPQALPLSATAQWIADEWFPA